MKAVKMTWPEVAVENFAEVATGGTPSTSRPEYWKGGDIPWLNSGELNKGVINKSENFITKEGLENSATKMMPENTVLIALTGATTGVSALLKIRACGNQSVTGILPSKRHNPNFLFRFIQSIRPKILADSYGGAQKHISQGYVKKLKIPLPPIEEQNRIAILLDEADGLRKLRAQADRRTAEFIPSLFHKMFGDPLKNSKRWPIKPVASFVEHFQGGRSLTPAEANEINGPYRVLKISAITWGEFRPNENKPVSAKFQPPADHFVRTGDLLFSRANTTELVAATSYVFETPPNLLLPDKLWRFVWKQPQTVEPLFIWWLFQSPAVRAELGRRASGTGGSMKNISQPKVMTLEVPVPPLPLQKEFAERVKEIRALETAQAQSRARLDALFASLLDRAFKGEL